MMVVATIREEIQSRSARTSSRGSRARVSPMIVLESPKGWTGPKIVDGKPNEGTFRSHQVPISISATSPPEHLLQLEQWLRSCRPHELFDAARMSARAAASVGAVGNKAHERQSSRERRIVGTRLANAGFPIACDLGQCTRCGRNWRHARACEIPRRNCSRQRESEELPHFWTGRNDFERIAGSSRRDAKTVGSRDRIPTDEYLAPQGRVLQKC